MAEPDYYELLGVDRTATLNEIRLKYRQRSKAENPDKGGDAKAYQLLTKAYNVLSDPEKRKRYDATGWPEKSTAKGSKDSAAAGAAGPRLEDLGRQALAKALKGTRLPIRVIGLSGLLCEISVESTSSVGEVKQAVCRELGVPEGQQRLCLGSEELADESASLLSTLKNVGDLPIELTLIRKTQAARLGNLDRVQIPLDQNDEVPCCSGASGQTPLHVASEFGHVGVVRELLERNASPTIEDSIGQTPLHRASRNGHLPCVRELLAHNAEPGLKDKLGQRAEDLAKVGRHTAVIELLREAAGAQKRPQKRRELKVVRD